MKVAFRVDAATHIGSGHVMRCLTLGDRLRRIGAEVVFLCRVYQGHLIDWLRSIGHTVIELNSSGNSGRSSIMQEKDGKETVDALGGCRPDWMVVDHYKFDCTWETIVKPNVRKLMVIDDLADRFHECDLLLDQNLVLNFRNRYSKRIKPNTKCALGPKFALVRSEFGRYRAQSILRREKEEINKLLIFMGGSDPENFTKQVVSSMKPFSGQFHLIVVVGKSYEHTSDLKEHLSNNIDSYELHIQTRKMAELMKDADLAITGGGCITWEKCVLGLPSIIIPLADHQKTIAEAIHSAGAGRYFGIISHDGVEMLCQLVAEMDRTKLRQMSRNAARICDGRGTERIVQMMTDNANNAV